MTVLAIAARVQARAINTFTTALTLVDIVTVQYISAIKCAVGVIAVFGTECPNHHVAVSVFSREIGISAIFALGVVNSSLGNFAFQI